MALFIVERPEKAIGLNTSRWSAVTNPVIFKIQRIDINIIGVVDNGGLVEVEFPIQVLLGFGTVVGDKIYLNSGPYDEVGTVQAIISNTKVTLNIPFVTISAGGFANFNTNRSNYRSQVRILKIENNNYRELITTGVFRPNEKGVTNIDISSWLNTLPQMINEFQYVNRNEKDINLGGDYNFQIRELFTDPSGPFIGVFPDPLDGNINFFVNAARQIQDEHGGNMAQFVPFIIPVSEAQKMRFLSGFVEPTRFKDFPFDLQFIYNEDLDDTQTKKEERSRDINGVLKDTESDALDNAQASNVNRLILEEGYDPLATSVDVFLENDPVIADQEAWAVPGYNGNQYDTGETAPKSLPIEG